MINLNSMPDDTLLNETQKLVREEREILSKILHHLREIDRRRLFSKIKYGSLFEYAVHELGYSEDQAYRRIQAMRLLKELPEIEAKINNGELNLTHLGIAQSLFKREAKEGQKTFSKEEKIIVLEKLEKTTKREAERVGLSFSSAPIIPAEKIRVVSSEDVEIKFTAKEELFHKIQKLKGLLAHKDPGISLSDLIDQLCDLGLEKWGKCRDARIGTFTNVSRDPKLAQTTHPEKILEETAPARVTVQHKTQSSQAQIRRDIWGRDAGRCKKCGSQYALEIDHIWPKALGGEDTRENLRLLCRSCNQRAAIEVFGAKKMEKYLSN